mmetsp:Transcript_100868/g.314451  ORF Transcript_100868/g.314451 Transcript_100868/m.314451 type:complete len:288 (+) Transcript_100868:659-1522(+)
MPEAEPEELAPTAWAGAPRDLGDLPERAGGGPRGGGGRSARRNGERALSTGSLPLAEGGGGSGSAGEPPLNLDVGGRIFRASAATLRKSPFLAALLERRGEDCAAELTFVDRSPELFHQVLEFLRTGLAFSSSALEDARLRAEFSVFGLDPDKIQPAPGSRSEEVVLGVRFERGAGGGGGARLSLSVLGPAAVLDMLWDARQELAAEGIPLAWRRAGPVLLADAELAEEPHCRSAAVPQALAGPLAKLWALEFREGGRSESSALGPQGAGGACALWTSETVTLRRRV